ncbi:MAG: hypothetical protein DRI34_00065 [Deltaproteobacteria bacterium]|nr:MAG: hypothetical protein DRI34_00065 [Deltaproteobacteria bacterium]
MSSPDHSTVDAIVLAGTHDSLVVEYQGRRLGKAFLPLGGCSLVGRVVQELLVARGVGRVFVAGPTEFLEESLAILSARQRGRVEIVAEGPTLVENGYRAFYRHLLPARGLPAPATPDYDAAAVAEYLASHPQARTVPALVVTADLPFLGAADVESFLQRCHPQAALVMGLVEHAKLRRLAHYIGRPEVLDAWKLGAIPLHGVEVRMTNLFLVRPGLADPRIYALLDEMYGHRRLLHTDGKTNVRSWRALARVTLRHCRRVNPWWRYGRALLNFFPAMAAGLLARASYRRSPLLARPFRLLLRQRDLEFIASLLLGTTAVMTIGGSPAPAIDIDVEESYRFLAAEDEAGYRQLRQALERLAAETAGPPGD